MFLVCFAVKEEAAPFARRARTWTNVRILITGMGARNTELALRPALEEPPTLVLTCGFAGGLNPALHSGQVVFSLDEQVRAESALRAAGGQPARFHFAHRIATTAAEKAVLRQATGADAVEMESQVVRDLCRERNIPSATVRVILDAAADDLPLDFNRLLTSDCELHAGRLAATLLKSPGKMGVLVRFRKQTQVAAEKLGEALAAAISHISFSMYSPTIFPQ
jgi:nucleoside phosphorylase